MVLTLIIGFLLLLCSHVDAFRGQSSKVRVRDVYTPALTGDDKFVQPGGKLVPESFGPRAVLTAGYDEKWLELLQNALDALEGGSEAGSSAVPVVVLGASDGKTILEDILEVRCERDHILPATPLHLRRPFVLFSGFDMTSIRKAVSGLVAQGAERPAIAMAVPRAMGKEIATLATEVINDWYENSPRAQKRT